MLYEQQNNSKNDNHRQYPDNNKIQNLIVTTKSYQAVNAVQSVMGRMMMTNNNNNNNIEDFNIDINSISKKENKENDSNINNNNENSNSTIILLCNGALSVRDELQDLWDAIEKENAEEQTNEIVPGQQQRQRQIRPNLLLATTTHGAYREKQNNNETAANTFDENDEDDDDDNNTNMYVIERRKVIHAGFGKTFIEDPDNNNNNNCNSNDDGNGISATSTSTSSSEICTLWNDVGLNCTSLPSEQMIGMLWNKLAANCVINPLTSIFRCTNGELLLEPSFLELQENILLEVANVAAGVLLIMEKEKEIEIEKRRTYITTTTAIDDNDNTNIKSSIRLVDEMRKFVTQCILDTRDNKSSMYQDIMKGQYTEIKHLNGYVVRKGKEMGICCPHNEDLYQRILELQNQSISSSLSS